MTILVSQQQQGKLFLV